MLREPLSPQDFVTVRPLQGAEFVIRVGMINELNEAWKGTPAKVFLTDPTQPNKHGSIEISTEEYDKLKLKLTGDFKHDPEELRQMYDAAMKAKEAENAAKAVECDHPTKKPAKKKAAAK